MSARVHGLHTEDTVNCTDSAAFRLLPLQGIMREWRREAVSEAGSTTPLDGPITGSAPVLRFPLKERRRRNGAGLAARACRSVWVRVANRHGRHFEISETEHIAIVFTLLSAALRLVDNIAFDVAGESG